MIARRTGSSASRNAARWLAFAVLLAAGPAGAQMAAITLTSAWMRPAQAGQDSARAYLPVRTSYARISPGGVGNDSDQRPPTINRSL